MVFSQQPQHLRRLLGRSNKQTILAGAGLTFLSFQRQSRLKTLFTPKLDPITAKITKFRKNWAYFLWPKNRQKIEKSGEFCPFF